MTRAAFNRDNVLTPEERAASARKCLQILDAEPNCTEDMSNKDLDFYVAQRAESKRLNYAPTELQLAWLRDLVEKHAQ